jgi:hypothetical protein
MLPERLVRWAKSLLLFALGCGPVQSSTLIVGAQAELAAAKTAQADLHAPFEYIAAEEYLHKAREEQSYADFQIAVIYAEKSRDCAKVARALAEAKTREAMGTTRPTHTTNAKCRPGPARLIPIPDPSEEASAIKARPLLDQQKQEQKAKPPPAEQKPAEKKPAQKKVVKPEEPSDPLPEGDAE